jgi:hypothetical protein
MSSIIWDREVAEVYDQTYRAKFEASVLDPIVDLLAGLAGGGPALEFAVGTGRVALPLSARGIAVHGLELSPHMAAQLRAKPGAVAVPVTIGDMTTTRVPGAPFTLVYLVANTIMNVTTQDAQPGGLRQRGRPAGAGRLLRGGGDSPPAAPGASRRDRPGLHPGPRSRRDRDLRRRGRADRVVAPLDRGQRPSGAPLRALPVRLAVRTRPHGQDRGLAAPGPLGGLVRSAQASELRR